MRMFKLILIILTLFLTACNNNGNLPLIYAPYSHHGEPTLKIDILNTGESDCIFITLDDYTLMINSDFTNSEFKIFEYLDSHNIQKLDYLIIPEFTEYSLNSIYFLSQFLEIEQVIFNRNNQDYSNYQDILQDKVIQFIEINETLTFSLNEVEFMIYLTSNVDTNQKSLLTHIQYYDQSLLFPNTTKPEYIIEAIMENKGLYEIIYLPNSEVEIEALEDFLLTVSPTNSIINCFNNNDYNSELLKTLADQYIQTFLTCNGPITIKLNQNTSSITQKLERYY